MRYSSCADNHTNEDAAPPISRGQLGYSMAKFRANKAIMLASIAAIFGGRSKFNRAVARSGRGLTEPKQDSITEDTKHHEDPRRMNNECAPAPRAFGFHSNVQE